MNRFTRFASIMGLLLQAAACSIGSPPTSAGIPSIASTTTDGPPFSLNTNTPVGTYSAPVTALDADAYHIQSFVPGFAIDISAGNFNDGTQLVHYSIDGGANQLWRFVSGNANSYQVQNPVSGKCVDVAAQSRSAGSQVVLETCGTSTSQQWLLTFDSNQNLFFRNVNSNMCLSVAASNPNAGAPLVQEACGTSKAESWHLTSKTYVTGYGNIHYLASPSNNVTAVSFDMIVPPEPIATGNLFVTPGLQPVSQSASFLPIGLGVLEPVLSWGGSCAATAQPAAYSTWWISGQYVNGGSNPGHSGCLTGSALSVDVGDTLTVSMALQGNVWSQTISDTVTGQSVGYTLDMLGQAQTDLLFSLIQYNISPVGDTIFENLVFSVAQPDNGFCVPTRMGVTDFTATGVLSPDMRTCSVAKVILRAQGVAATTANQ